MDPLIIVAIAVGVIILFALFGGILSRYRKCPSDKILVIYGKVGSDKSGQARSARCIHGGAAFIVPIIQSYQYMDLTPISINVDLRNALSKQNIRVDVPSSFTVGISTEPGVMQNAAERLLGLKMQQVQELAKDIIFGQLRLVIATMEIEETVIETVSAGLTEAMADYEETVDKELFTEFIKHKISEKLEIFGLILMSMPDLKITENK